MAEPIGKMNMCVYLDANQPSVVQFLAQHGRAILLNSVFCPCVMLMSIKKSMK